MNYTYTLSNKKELRQLIEEYVKTLSSPFDSFLEDQIEASDFYRINEGGGDAGYFAFNKDGYITQFYLKQQHLKYAQSIFSDILKNNDIDHALVFTGDELFLSLVLDREIIVNKQAYFFQDSRLLTDESRLYQSGEFRAAQKDDIAEILQVSGDFFDSLNVRVDRGEIFVFKEKGKLLGAGIVEHGRILKDYTSIGMFVNEQHRQKGIGRTIIARLRNWCYDNGTIPICGCWYYNHNSKKTLEGAGMITKTRLLNVEFIEGENDSL